MPTLTLSPPLHHSPPCPRAHDAEIQSIKRRFLRNNSEQGTTKRKDLISTGEQNKKQLGAVFKSADLG
jgi:hypothetical protein